MNKNDRQLTGLSVEVRNGDFGRALAKFKKMVQSDGILQEYKERQTYLKPSERRNRKKAAAKSRWQKYLRKRFTEQGY